MDDAPAVAEPKKPWFEPVSAILMGFSTLGSAWCSYQSSEWGGQSSDHASEVTRLQREVAAMHLEENQIKSLHMDVFMELMDARFAGNERLMKFYTDRFTSEIKTAYDAWIAQNPFENPKADPHPFVPHLYKSRFTNQIAESLAEEEKHSVDGKLAGTVSARYLSSTVLLASTLFFAGTSRNFDRRVVRQAMLGFALALFLYCLARIITLPIA